MVIVDLVLDPNCPEKVILWCPRGGVIDYSDCGSEEVAFKHWQESTGRWIHDDEEKIREVFFSDLRIFSKEEFLEMAKHERPGEEWALCLGYVL